MNWTLALPEIVLACFGMGVLLFGVLRKQDSTLLATMFTIFGFLVTGLLVATGLPGTGFHGQFVADPFSTFNKLLILVGASFAALMSLDWNEKQGIGRFEFPSSCCSPSSA